MEKFRKPHGNNRGAYGGKRDDRSFVARPPVEYGKQDRGERPRFDNRGREKQLFDAICSNCGKKCEVPFRPNGRKPVYCSECFNKDRTAQAPAAPFRQHTSDSQGEFRNREPKQDPRIDDLLKQVHSLHAKVDAALKALAERQAPAPAAAAVTSKVAAKPNKKSGGKKSTKKAPKKK